MTEARTLTGKDFYEMSGPALLEYCGTDAGKWAEAFCRIKEVQGWSAADIDEGLMMGWFANAIEHSTAFRASAAAAQPVAWTNKAQLGFLDDPACADIPMAMWSKTSPASPIPLYAALAKPPKDGSTVTREADRIDTAKRVALAVLNTIGAGGDNLEIYNAVLSSLSRPERGEG